MSDKQDDNVRWSRRGFLKVSAGAAAAVSLSPIVGSGCASVPGSAFPAGTASSFPQGQSTKIEDVDVFIFHTEEGYAAISAECTHMSCAVEKTEGGNFECPCHGSVFGARGEVLDGPAESPLTWFAVTIEGDKVVVDPTRVVDAGTFTPAG